MRPYHPIILAAILNLTVHSSMFADTLTKGTTVAPYTQQIKSGEYVWDPAISPAGPVVIIITLPEQVLSVYRNGVRIGRSTISSGKAGHHTPKQHGSKHRTLKFDLRLDKSENRKSGNDNANDR